MVNSPWMVRYTIIIAESNVGQPIGAFTIPPPRKTIEEAGCAVLIMVLLMGQGPDMLREAT